MWHWVVDTAGEQNTGMLAFLGWGVLVFLVEELMQDLVAIVGAAVAVLPNGKLALVMYLAVSQAVGGFDAVVNEVVGELRQEFSSAVLAHLNLQQKKRRSKTCHMSCAFNMTTNECIQLSGMKLEKMLDLMGLLDFNRVYGNQVL